MPTPLPPVTNGAVIQILDINRYIKPVQDMETGASFYAADTGSANSYAVTMDPVPTSYTAGMLVRFKATNASTGAATLNVNALGIKTIKKSGNRDLETGDILAGQVLTVVFDGTNFQLQGPINIPATSKGDLLVHGGSGLIRLPVGANNQVLTADSAQTAGVKWAAGGGGGSTGQIASLWNLCPATAQTINSTTFADVTSATGSLTALGGKPLLFHVGVGYEAVAGQGTRKGYFRISISTGTTTYLPSSTGFPFISPYNLDEVAAQGHVFYLASLTAGTYTVKLQAKMNTSGESAQITSDCNLTCAAIELG